MERFKRFRALTRVEKRYLARAAIWLPATALMLRAIGYQRTLAFYSREKMRPGDHLISTRDEYTVQTVARVVNIAANHGFYRARCLVRSMVLYKLLRNISIPCNLVLGANKGKDDFVAHAWVEWQGVVINDSADVKDRYTAFDSPADNSA